MENEFVDHFMQHDESRPVFDTVIRYLGNHRNGLAEYMIQIPRHAITSATIETKHPEIRTGYRNTLRVPPECLAPVKAIITLEVDLAVPLQFTLTPL